MKVTAIKTEKITPNSTSLSSLCDRYIKSIDERTIIVIASKIVSLCEGSVLPDSGQSKYELAKQLADHYIPLDKSLYNYMITVKNNTLISSSGIDQSNGDGYFVLWPEDSQKTANELRDNLVKSQKLKHIGVLITDTMSKPLRRGTSGIALAHSGFTALNDYRGKPDSFKYKMRTTVVNVAESLAAAAVVTMGEGNEQTPLAIIEDVPFVSFQDRNPTNNELKELSISMENDLFAPLLLSAPWQKRKR